MGRFQNNPSIGCVDPTSTHACPLAWGNNNDGFAKVMKRGFKVKNKGWKAGEICDRGHECII
jgi:hypothetical protein